MKKYIVLLSVLAGAAQAKADMFGGDIPILVQIVTNTANQLIELRKIVETSREDVDLINDINRGIHDTLELARTIDPNIDPGLYQNIKSLQEILGKLGTIYGPVVDSPDASAQRDSDEAAADAFKAGSEIFNYATDIEKVDEQLRRASDGASPGRAQQITAQSLGIILHVMNQSLKAQATGLKLQAQKLAQDNKHQKDETREYLGTSDALSDAMKTPKISFERPRF